MRDKTKLSETIRFLGMLWFFAGPFFSIKLAFYLFPKLASFAPIPEFLGGVSAGDPILGLGILLYLLLMIVLFTVFIVCKKKFESAN